MKKRETPLAALLDALREALEEGVAILDTDRTFAIATEQGTFAIIGILPCLAIHGEPIRLRLRDRFNLFRFRYSILRQNARDEREHLATIARAIRDCTHAHRQDRTTTETDGD